MAGVNTVDAGTLKAARHAGYRKALPGPAPRRDPPYDESLLDVLTVAARLTCSKATVYRLVYKGQLKAVPIGTGRRPRIRIPESDLNRFMEEGSTS